jgi:hypothetical protein
MLRRWKWNSRGPLATAPVRCKRAEWYLVRARLEAACDCPQLPVVFRYLHDARPIGHCCVWLHETPAASGELLGWLETPADTTHLELGLVNPAAGQLIAEVALHNVSERDPKCHPLANVPRWSVYQPPFPLERVVLPASLESLTPLLEGSEVQILASPASRKALARAVRGAASVLDPAWVDELGLTLADVERLAGNSWLLVDLATLARLVTQAGVAQARLVTHRDQHGLMSARVEYADVPTRGLALQDVLPYSAFDERGRFAVRAIKAGRSWRAFADDVGFATLLSAETPWEGRHGDILSAVRAVGRGELLATDVPWLVAGCQGPLVAPRLAAHLLRMHLGRPLGDHQQYWNRWGAGDTLVRDIADLPSRCPSLRTARWASRERRWAHLGITQPALGRRPARQLLICTGRIDQWDSHDGVPAEPLMIFMKWLAREVCEQTPWARKHLEDQSVTWQFDTAEGLKYAVQYEAARAFPGVPTETVRVRFVGAGEAADTPGTLALVADEGLHGDGAFEMQQALTSRLRALIERRGTGRMLA